MRKRLLRHIIMLICVFSLIVYNASGASSYKSYFSHEGLSSQSESEFMMQSIVMRVGSCEGYIDNQRVYLFEGCKDVRALIADGIPQIPVRFVLSGLKCSFDKTESDISFEYNGKKYVFSDGDTNGCFVSNGQIYMSAPKLAELLDLGFYTDTELIFLSVNANLYKDGIPDEVHEKLSQYLGYEWQYLNMGSALGYVTGIYVHPKNPDLMYAAGDVCGLFRWDTETQTWFDCNRNEFEIANANFTNSMGSIALDPSNENVVYAVFGNDSVNRGSEGSSIDIFKSVDYGKSWTRCFFGKPMCAYSGRSRWSTAQMAVDPNNPNIIYAGTRYDGLYKNEHGGEDGFWYQVSGVPTGPSKTEFKDSAGVAGVVFDSNSPVINGKTSVIYVSVVGYGVYKSTDCGETFTPMKGSPKIGAQCMFLQNGKLYVSGAAATYTQELKDKYGIELGVYRYDGKKWDNITPTKSAPYYNSISVNPKNDNEMFCFKEGWVNADSGAYNARSTDGGKTWQKVTQMPDYNCMGTAIYDTRDGNAVYVTWGFGIYKLTNIHGKIDDIKIEDVSEGIDLLCIFSMRSLPGSRAPQLLMAVADFGQRAIDNFRDGSYRTTKYQGNSYGLEYCQSDPSIVITAGSTNQKSGNGYIEISTDFGNTYKKLDSWKTKNAPASVAVSAAKQTNGYPVLMAYSATGDIGIHRSLDFGETWEYVLPLKLKDGTTNGRSLTADCVDGNKFYMLFENGCFYVTEDSGASWTMSYAFSGLTTWPQTTKAVPNVENMVWVNGRKDGIYTTSDGGYTWSRLPGISFCSCFGFGKNKEGSIIPTAYMYGTYNGKESIYMSDNLGQTWTDIGNPGTNPGYITDIEGDANVYGRVYIGGKSILCGQTAGTDNDSGAPVIILENQSKEYSVDRISGEQIYKVKGKVSKTSDVTINGSAVSLNGDNSFEYNVTLELGENTISVDACDSSGKKAQTAILNVLYDPEYIGVGLALEKEAKTRSLTYTIRGVASKPCHLQYNENVIDVGEDKSFEIEYPLQLGENYIHFTAYDDLGHTSDEQIIMIDRDEIPPVLEYDDISPSTTDKMAVIRGTLNEDGEVRINGKTINLSGRSFKKLIALTEGENSIYIQARDSVLNVMKPIELIINRQGVQDSIMEIPYADTAFKDIYKFDGDVSEWQLLYEPQIITDDPSCTAEFALRWDEENLYIAVAAEDDTLCSSAASVYNNDAVEIYLDGDNSKTAPYDQFDKQFMYQYDGTSGTTDYKTKVTDYGYSMEIVIPWSIINTAVSGGMLVGFDMDICDNNSGGASRSGVLTFSGTVNDYKDTTQFATLRLIR